MRIPKNKISSSYAPAGEFVYKQSREPFSGSYYAFNGIFYTGKEYSTGSLELQKSPPAQPIIPYTNYDSALYNTLTSAAVGFTGGVVNKVISSLPVKSPEFLILTPTDPSQDNINSNVLSLEPVTIKKRYFCRKLLPKPTESNPIKEITEAEYKSFSSGINSVLLQTVLLTETITPQDGVVETPADGSVNPNPTNLNFKDLEEVKRAEQRLPGIKAFLRIP